MAENNDNVVINALTGLPVENTTKEVSTEPVINSITGQAAKGRPKAESYFGNIGGETFDVTKSMSFKEYESFLDYDVDVRRGIDHVEARAQNQSTLQQWGRGLMKANITAVGALAENTIGLFWGLGSLATGGSFYDNAFGRAIDDMNEWAAETMPNYYTRAEQQADAFSLTNLTSANFWADKVANGAGYVLGSIATDVALAFVSGGTSLGLTAARYAAKFGKAAKVLSAAEKASALKNTYRLTKAAQKGQKIGSTLTEAGKAATKLGRGSGWKTAYARAENGLISAIGESNVEARQAKNETRQSLVDSWLADNEGKTVDDIPQETLDKIEDSATAAGNTVFAINMPIVGGTNAITIGKMLGPGYRKSVQKLAQQESKQSLFNIRRARRNVDADAPFVEAGLDRNWAGRMAYRANKYAGDAVKSSASEAFQEGSQVFAGAFAEEYYTDKYKNGPESGGLVHAIERGLKTTFGTKEGIESMLIGAIIGGGTVSVSNAARRLRGKQTSNQVRQENTQKALDLLNSGALRQPIQNIQDADKASALEQRMTQAAAIAADTNVDRVTRRRAHKMFKDAQYNLYAQQAFSLINQGRMDLVMEQLDDAKDLTDEEFKKAFGYQTDQPLPEGGKAAIVDKLKSRLEGHKNTIDRINEVAPAMQPTTGLPRKMMSQEAIEQEELEIEANNFYRQALFGRAAQIDGHTDRMGKMYAEMQALTGNAIDPDTLNNYQYDLVGREAFEDVDGVQISPDDVSEVISGDIRDELDRVEDSIINPLDKLQFQQIKEDYLHLAAERQAVINSYEALTGPEGPVTAEFLQARQQRMEAVAAQEKLQKEVDTIISTAETPSDFSDFPANATDAQKNAAIDRAEELGKEINNLANETYEGKTLEELNAIDRDALAKEENGRQKLAALDVAIAAAEKDPSGVFGGRVDNTTNQEYEADIEQSRNNAENQDNISPEEDTRGEEQPTEQPTEEQPEDRTDDSEQDSPTSTDPEIQAVPGASNIGVVDNADYQTDANGRIQLDANGKLISNPKGQYLKEGVPIEIDHSARQNVDPNGEVLTLELGNTDRDKTPTIDPWKTRSILVKKGDTVIGVLKNYNPKFPQYSSDRKAIYEALAAGKTVTITGKPTKKTSISNVVDQNGEKVFSPIQDIMQDPVFGAVQVQEGHLIIDPGQNPLVGIGGAQQQNMHRNLSRTTTVKLTPGQMVMGITTPNGTAEGRPVSTKKISEDKEAYDLAVALAIDPSQQDLARFEALVGLNTIEDEEFANPDLFLQLEESGGLKFHSKTVNGFIVLDAETLAKLNTKGSIELPTAMVGKLRLDAEVLKKELVELIGKKRFHIEKSLINTNATFTNPITGESMPYRQYALESNNGKSPLLNIDTIPEVGLFHNTGLDFSDVNIEGKPLSKKEKEETSTAKETPPPGPAPTNNTKGDTNTGGPRGKRGKHKRRGKGKTTPAAAPAQTSSITISPGQIDMSNYGPSYKLGNLEEGGKTIVSNPFTQPAKISEQGIVEMILTDADKVTLYPISVDVSQTSEYKNYEEARKVYNAERKRLIEEGRKDVNDMTRGMSATVDVRKKDLVKLVLANVAANNAIYSLQSQADTALTTAPAQEVTQKTQLKNVIAAWLNSDEGSLANQTAEQSAAKFTVEYMKRNPVEETESLADDLFGTIRQGLEIQQLVETEIKKQRGAKEQALGAGPTQLSLFKQDGKQCKG